MMEMMKENCLSGLVKSSTECVFGSGVITSAVEDIESCVNLSSILSKLVSEAGKLCNAYASDLFHEWRNVLADINKKKSGITSYLFGFYDSGVDSTQEVINQLCNGNKLERYNKVYRMDVSVGALDVHEEAYLRASLYQVDMEEE